jgi:hypothetical protein
MLSLNRKKFSLWSMMLDKSSVYYIRIQYLLKVPKREIFDGSDFPDFYTMKSLRVNDFGVKIKKKFKNI